MADGDEDDAAADEGADSASVIRDLQSRCAVLEDCILLIVDALISDDGARQEALATLLVEAREISRRRSPLDVFANSESVARELVLGNKQRS